MPIGAANNMASSTPITAYSVFCTPSSVETSSQPGSATSAQVTANVTGGQAPFTFLWSRVSGSSLITVSNSTADKVSFNASGSSENEFSAVFRVTVTDDLAVQRSVDINVDFFFV